MAKIYLKRVKADKNNGCLQAFTHHRCYFSTGGQCQARAKGVFEKYCNDDVQKSPWVYIEIKKPS